MILGIDLGTTYSAGAYLNDEGDPEIIENSEGERLTPSVVLIEDGNVIVGDVAKGKIVTQPQDVIATVKNSMGQKCLFKVSNGKEYTPEQISGYIIRKIVDDAEERLNRKIDKVIITVPAYFSDAQRKSTEQAAQIAGVTLAKSLLNEPTAAAIYFAHKKKLKDAKILVYDLGGGTFDVTVLEVRGGKVEVRATDGIIGVGGHFFDEEIVKFVCEKMQRHGIDLMNNKDYADDLQELYVKAEKCKIQLSTKQQTDIPMRIEKIRENITITREFLEDKLKSFYMRSEVKIKSALHNARLNKEDIDEVLLIGGSSKIPYIAKKIGEFFGKTPSSEISQQEAVALGAALFAKTDISDVCSHGIGIVTVDPQQRKMVNSILIKKNTKLPVEVRQRCFTYGDSDQIPVQITEGEFEEIDYVTTIGKDKVDLPKGLPKNTAVDIVIKLDENQLIRLYVNIESIKLHKEFQFKRLNNMQDEELKGLIKAGAGQTVSEEDKKENRKEEERKEEAHKEEAPKEEKKEEKQEGAKRIQTTTLAEQLKKKKKKKIKIVQDEPMSIEERFKDIYGMKPIRESLVNFYNVLRMQTGRQENDLNTALRRSTHFAISGGRGCGKTLLATSIGQLLYDFGIRGDEQAVLVDARDLAKNFEQLQSLSDVTVIIENIEKCADEDLNFDRESIVWPLLALLRDKKDDISVIITGSKDAITRLLEKEREIRQYLYNQCQFEISKYTAEELLDIAVLMAKNKQFYLDDAARFYMSRTLRKKNAKAEFECAYEIEQMIDDAVTRLANRLAAIDDPTEMEMATLKVEDFEVDNSDDDEVEKLLEQLDRLTGLKSVKEKVREKIGEVVANREKEALGIESRISTSNHMVFLGSPGTGKTTVAKIIGDIYYYLGVLPEKKLVVCGVSDLVSQYVGGTSEKARKKVEEAIGGVLFIDEAYMLADSRNKYNADAVAAILTGMEDHRDELMVIMAGYQDAMEAFFKDTNEGLKGRFPAQNRILFEDYTEEEMVEIFKGYAKNAKLKIEEGTDELIKSLLEERGKEDGFNNARGVRNVFEEVGMQMTKRLDAIAQKTKEDYEWIKRKDIEGVLGRAEERELDKQAYINQLYAMTGLAGVKKELTLLVDEIEANRLYESQKGNAEANIHIGNMFFLGNPGTGKTTVARVFAKILEQLGVLKKKSRFIECTREDFVSEHVGGSGPKTKKLVEGAFGGVLFIDEAYRLYEGSNDTYGKEAVETLMKLMEDNRDKLLVIAAGYTKNMQDFLQANPGLKSRFPQSVVFDDYTAEELLFILKQMAGKDDYTLNAECDGMLLQYFETRKRIADFGNAREVRELYLNMQKQTKIRILNLHRAGEAVDKAAMWTMTPEDVEKTIGADRKKTVGMEELLAQLDAMTGLSNIKEQVHRLIGFIQGIRQKKGAHVDLAKELGRMHMVFQGAPGTGKTTVARLIGQIYRELGLLKGDAFVECDRSTLVGAVIGATEQITTEKIDKAMDGVLFIDEAYALASGGGNDFGQHAIDVLLKRMEDDRHRLLVILAGYTGDMEKLFAMNQGFKSRIRDFFTFENYSNEELLTIFDAQAAKEGIAVSDEAKELIKGYFEEKRKSPDFANARDVGNLFLKAKEALYSDSQTSIDENGNMVLDAVRMRDVMDGMLKS